MRKKIALTCKDPGQFFRTGGCRDCEHYEKCDYFNKEKKKKKGPRRPQEVK